jgi:hypothetical protein
MITKVAVEYAYSVGRTVCPECLNNERSFSAWVDNTTGHILGKCFRASCGAFAKFPLHGETPVAREKNNLIGYVGDIRKVPEAQSRKFFDTFGLTIDQTGIEWSHRDRFLIPILSPYGAVRGHAERIPWWETVPAGEPKMKTWKLRDEPMVSWTSHDVDNAGSVIIVEDQISAMKVAQACSVRALALLGTGITHDALIEIQSITDSVVLALDKDATGHAFSLARKFGPGFKHFRVQCLDKDIKNMLIADVASMFMRYV